MMDGEKPTNKRHSSNARIDKILQELHQSTMETWRFQVDSFWQRSSYFGVFETVALGLCWKLLNQSRGLGLTFAAFGAVLTILWFWNNYKTYSYVKYWWDCLREIERRRNLNVEELDLAEGIEFPKNIKSKRIKHPKKGLPYHWVVQCVPILFFLAWLALLLSPCLGWVNSAGSSKKKDKSSLSYFDAHNHGISAILPYYAYADLKAFIADPGDPTTVTPQKRQKLWNYIVSSQLTRTINLTGPENRTAPGAVATIAAYDKADALTPRQIDGALERVLTSTPWTEFDSAYEFRSGSVEKFLTTYRDEQGAL